VEVGEAEVAGATAGLSEAVREFTRRRASLGVGCYDALEGGSIAEAFDR
jgi:hypothetical protein